jgi:adenylate cyclase
MAEERVQRRLAAILAADIAGYSRLMGGDETGTLLSLKNILDGLIKPAVAKYRGRIVKLMGDGILAEFASVVEAVECSLEIQQGMTQRNIGIADDRALRFRIGIHLGDVIVENDDIFGDGVNVAARIEGLAEPDGIAISDDAYRQVRDRIDVPWQDGGTHQVKNIARAVTIWRWTLSTEQSRSVDNPTEAPASLSETPSIAVLPFDNMSNDAEQAYFADGIAEDIITDLSKVSGLFVIARNSSFAYRDQSLNLGQICGELGVRYILEGSVRRAGNRVRINAQLIDGSSEGHIWADRFDRDLADIFKVQDEVTREIVSALRVTLTVEERSSRTAQRKVDPEAYDLLVRGRDRLFQFNAPALAEARILLKRAIALDPEMAVAQAFLSLVNSTEHLSGWNDPPPDHMEKAVEIAEQATRIDPQEPQAYHALALANLWLGRFDVAERSANRAVELNPNFAGGYAALGQVQDMIGNHAHAIECANTVLSLDPKYEIALQLRGRAQFALGHDNDALDSFEKRILSAPKSETTRFFLAAIHGHSGRIEEAHRLWREILEINPEFSVSNVRRMLPYKSHDVLDRLTEGLRKAGLPE